MADALAGNGATGWQKHRDHRLRPCAFAEHEAIIAIIFSNSPHGADELMYAGDHCPGDHSELQCGKPSTLQARPKCLCKQLREHGRAELRTVARVLASHAQRKMRIGP